MADDDVLGLRHRRLEAAEEDHAHRPEGAHQQRHVGLGQQQLAVKQADGAHAHEGAQEAKGHEARRHLGRRAL